MLASGMGGAVVSEVVNLWKGGWAAGKGVKDIDWGIGRELGRTNPGQSDR